MIIGVSGKINSGKDLVGKVIQYLTTENTEAGKAIGMHCTIQEYLLNSKDTHSCNDVFVIRKFADKLKDIVCLLLGCTREQLESHGFKEKELGEEWWYWKSLLDGSLLPYKGIHSFENESKEFALNFELYKLTPRLLLQLLGTQCGRQIIHPNIWVNATMASYKKDLKEESNYDLGDVLTDIKHLGKPHPPLEYPNWVITDTRFVNEADAIKQRGGIVIRVNRPCKECGLVNTHKMSCSKNIKEHESETGLDDYKFDYIIDNSEGIDYLIEQVRIILIREGII